MHSMNGNPSKKGSYFLLTWNKGNGKFYNMRDNISITIDRFKPDFFAIQEANFEIGNDKGFVGYNIECNQLSKSYSISRSILLIKNGIQYKRRYDLETQFISSVWVQVSISKRVSILICSFYRQWSIPAALNIQNSSSIHAQNERYKLFSGQIENF